MNNSDAVRAMAARKRTVWKAEGSFIVAAFQTQASPSVTMPPRRTRFRSNSDKIPRAAAKPAKRMTLVSFVAYISPAEAPAAKAHPPEGLLAYLHPAAMS